jgi:hypothetical protein
VEGQVTSGRDAALVPLDALIDYVTDDPTITNPCDVQILVSGQIIIRRDKATPECQIIFSTPPGMVTCPWEFTPTTASLWIYNSHNTIDVS